jgi:hypothetical protein
LVSFVDLRDQLVSDHDRLMHSDELLEMASVELRGALAASRLTAFGRRYEGAEYEPIRATVFMDSTIAINWWDTVQSELQVLFDDVQFQTAEVVNIWPTVASIGQDADRSPTIAISGG